MGKKIIIQSILMVSLFVSITACVATEQMNPTQHRDVKNNIEMSLVVNKETSNILVSTSDPIALRTFIMQGFSLRLKGEDTYTIPIPSAKDVSEKVLHHPGEVKATIQGNNEKRPDIRPVLDAINAVEVKVLKKGDAVGIVESFNVSINPTTGVIMYDILVSRGLITDAPSQIVLFSEPVNSDVEFVGDKSLGNNETKPQPFGASQPVKSNDKQKKIYIEYSFE